MIEFKECPRCWVSNCIENTKCPLCGHVFSEAASEAKAPQAVTASASCCPSARAPGDKEADTSSHCPDKADPAGTVTVAAGLRIHQPSVSLRHDNQGGIDILLDDWVYVHINYNYRYTSNASRRQLAEAIAAVLKPSDLPYESAGAGVQPQRARPGNK